MSTAFERRAVSTHHDEGVGLPVGRGDLVGEPGGDRFGGLDAEFRERLGYEAHTVQEPLGSVVVVFKEAVRLGRKNASGVRESCDGFIINIIVKALGKDKMDMHIVLPSLAFSLIGDPMYTS